MLHGIYNSDNVSNNGYINRDTNIAQVSDAQKRYATSPFKNSHFVDEMQISSEALNLFQKEQDIKKFTSIALSESDNSHLDLIDKAFSKGVVSPFTDDSLEELLNNSKLWDDISG